MATRTAGGTVLPADPGAGPWAQATGLAFRVIFGLVLVAALAWPFTNVRQVQPDRRAVVLRLGRVVRVQGAGLLLAWPRPFERVVMLPSPERQIEFSFDPLRSPGGADDTRIDWAVDPDPRRNAAFFMTADGVVHLTATLFYRITDPVDYMFEQAHVAPALKALTMASLVALAAARDTDTLVVTRSGAALPEADRDRRERLRTDLVAAIDARLAGLRAQGAGLGITVGRVDLGTALPSGAKAAFEGVLIATQQADALVAEARGVAARIEQSAQQNRTAMLADASAAADERRSTATAHTASIRALAQVAAGAAGQALLTEIYNDRMHAILHRAGAVEAFDPSGGLRLVLPGRTR